MPVILAMNQKFQNPLLICCFIRCPKEFHIFPHYTLLANLFTHSFTLSVTEFFSQLAFLQLCYGTVPFTNHFTIESLPNEMLWEDQQLFTVIQSQTKISLKDIFFSSNCVPALIHVVKCNSMHPLYQLDLL